MGADYIASGKEDVVIVISNGAMIQLKKIIIPVSKINTEEDKKLYIEVTGAERR